MFSSSQEELWTSWAVELRPPAEQWVAGRRLVVGCPEADRRAPNQLYEPEVLLVQIVRRHDTAAGAIPIRSRVPMRNMVQVAVTVR